MKYGIVAILFFCLPSSFSQYGINCEVEQWKLNIITPGLEFEKGMSATSTLNFRLGYTLFQDFFTEEPYNNLELFPSLRIQNRHYFNLFRVSHRARPFFGNAGEYLAPTLAVLNEDHRVLGIIQEKGYFGYAGLMFGIQRNFFNGFTFSVETGSAYFVGEGLGVWQPMFNMTLGWMISERRWCRR